MTLEEILEDLREEYALGFISEETLNKGSVLVRELQELLAEVRAPKVSER